jgi:hypothetical protein
MIVSHDVKGNYSGFEALIDTMQRFAEDVSDPANQKVAVIFFSRCVSTWGQPFLNSPDIASNGHHGGNQGLPGFERFIYERLIPTAFRVPSLPNFNPKDGQMMVVSPIYLCGIQKFREVYRFYTKLQTCCKPSVELEERRHIHSS